MTDGGAIKYVEEGKKYCFLTVALLFLNYSIIFAVLSSSLSGMFCVYFQRKLHHFIFATEIPLRSPLVSIYKAKPLRQADTE